MADEGTSGRVVCGDVLDRQSSVDSSHEPGRKSGDSQLTSDSGQQTTDDEQGSVPAPPGDPMSENFRDVLNTFDNPHPDRDYTVESVCPEFTSVCPVTGQPDFGTLTITYVPGELCFELKSLKLYLQQYRNHGVFYEDVTNRVLDDLVAVVKPRWMQVTAEFTPRGGIRTNVLTEYVAEGFNRPAAIC